MGEFLAALVCCKDRRGPLDELPLEVVVVFTVLVGEEGEQPIGGYDP